MPLEENLKIERRNGLFSSLGQPESLEHLPKFIQDAGLLEAPDEGLFEPYLVETQGGITEFLRGVSTRLGEFFARYDPQPISEQEGFFTIAINELHCPHVAGATAKLTVKEVREEKSTCSVKILGIGGGDEFIATISAAETIETAGNCVATVHLLPAIFERCAMNTPDSRRIEFTRLKEVRPRSLVTRGQVITDDACATLRSGAPVADDREIFEVPDLGSGKLTRKLATEAGETWSGTSGVKLDKIGVELNADYQVTKKYATEMEYTLVEGYRYVAVKPADYSSWLWSWDKIS